jgi:hypothetical protein
MSRIIFQATPSLKMLVAGSTPKPTYFADCQVCPQLETVPRSFRSPYRVQLPSPASFYLPIIRLDPLIVRLTLSDNIFADCNVDNNTQVLFTKMSGRGGGRNNGRGGRHHGGRGGCGRGQNYTGSANTTKKGLCGNHGTNVVDFGQSLQQI